MKKVIKEIFTYSQIAISYTKPVQQTSENLANYTGTVMCNVSEPYHSYQKREYQPSKIGINLNVL